MTLRGNFAQAKYFVFLIVEKGPKAFLVRVFCQHPGLQAKRRAREKLYKDFFFKKREFVLITVAMLG